MNDSKVLLQTLLNDEATEEQILLAVQQFHMMLQQHNHFEALSSMMNDAQFTSEQFLSLLDKRLKQHQAKLDLQLQEYKIELNRTHAKLQALLITAVIIGSLLCITASLLISYNLPAQFITLGSEIFSTNYLSALYSTFSKLPVIPTYLAIPFHFAMMFGSLAIVDDKKDPGTSIINTIALSIFFLSYLSLRIALISKTANISQMGVLSPALWTLITWLASAGLYLAAVPAVTAGFYFLTSHLYDVLLEKTVAQQSNDLSTLQNATAEKSQNKDEKYSIQTVISELKITKETVKHTLNFGLFSMRVVDQPVNASAFYEESNNMTEPAYFVSPQAS